MSDDLICRVTLVIHGARQHLDCGGMFLDYGGISHKHLATPAITSAKYVYVTNKIRFDCLRPSEDDVENGHSEHCYLQVGFGRLFWKGMADGSKHLHLLPKGWMHVQIH